MFLGYQSCAEYLAVVQISLAGSPHEHLLVLHSHTQPGNLLCMCSTWGHQVHSSLLLFPCRYRHRQIYLEVASSVLFQFGELGTRPEKLLDQKSKNLLWSSAPGDSQGTEMAKKFAETTKSSDAFPKLMRDYKERSWWAMEPREMVCDDGAGLKPSWWENCWSPQHHSTESLRSNDTHTAPGRKETFLKVPRRQQKPRPTWPSAGTAKKPWSAVAMKEVPRKAKKLAASMAKQ